MELRRIRAAARHVAVPSKIAVGSGAVALSWDAVRLVLFLNVLVGVSRIHGHFPPLAAIRPLMLLLALAGAFIILNPSSVAFRRLTDTWPAKVVLGLGLMACASVPFGISIGRAGLHILDNYSRVIIPTFFMIAATRNARDLATFTWAYVLACGIISYLAIFSFDLAQQGPDTTYRLVGTYTFDANELSCVLLLGLALTLLMFRASTGPRKWLCAAILVSVGIAFARAGSRGGFVGLIAVGLYLLFSLKEVPVKRAVFVAAVLGGLVVGAPQGYWDKMKTIATPQEDYNWSSEDGRKELAKRGLGYMYEHPLFGIGIGNFPMAEGVISEKAENWVPGTGIRWATAHNSYVLAGAELGFPGMILYSLLVLGGVPAMIRLRRRLPSYWARGDPEQRFLYLSATYFPVALVGFGASSFFVSLTFSFPSHFLAVLLAGLYASVQAKLAREGVRGAPSNSRRTRRVRSRSTGAHSAVVGGTTLPSSIADLRP